MSKKKRLFFGAEMLCRVAAKMGVRVVAEPEWSEAVQLTFKNGVRRYVRSGTFDLNSVGAAAIAKDKGYARFFMKHMGYPVPHGETFFREDFRRAIGSSRNGDAACRFAQKVGFPVIVKPNSGGMGEGVFLAHTMQQVSRALRHVFTLDRIALVEAFIPGVDIRILVLDDAVVAAYQRMPLSIEGDGKTCVEVLLARHVRSLKQNGRTITISCDDPRIRERLKRHGYTLKTIVPKGARISLLVNANLSTGGSLRDVTETLHPTFKKAAIQLTKDMGLRFCGVDMLIDGDIAAPHARWCILEVNGSPSVKHFSSYGRAQKKRVEEIYRALITKMGQ